MLKRYCCDLCQCTVCSWIGLNGIFRNEGSQKSPCFFQPRILFLKCKISPDFPVTPSNQKCITRKKSLCQKINPSGKCHKMRHNKDSSRSKKAKRDVYFSKSSHVAFWIWRKTQRSNSGSWENDLCHHTNRKKLVFSLEKKQKKDRFNFATVAGKSKHIEHLINGKNFLPSYKEPL